MPNQPIEIIAIDSWQDFVAHIRPGGRFQSWAFRGHSDSSWGLWSTLSRRLQNAGVLPDYWSEQEARIIRIFKRKAHLLLEHVPDDADEFQWLSIIQHYGGPTRLVDFTWSPYVAAFFALEHATRPAAIWAVHPSVLWEHNKAMPEASTPGGLSLRTPGVFQTHFLPGTKDLVYQGEPGIMNRRLSSQNGTFLVPARLDKSVEAIIADSYPDPGRIVIKFEINTPGVRAECMQCLYAMNLTPFSLFADLAGLAMSLNYELEHHWAFDPRTGSAFPGFENDQFLRSHSLQVNDSRFPNPRASP